MKKFFIVVSMIVILCLCVGFSITEYWSEDFWDNSICYTPSSFRDVCFASVYNCKNSTENIEINIPNEINGYRVIAVGGNTGKGALSPFVIDFPNITAICEETSLPQNAKIVDYDCILNLGDNVRHISVSDMKSYYQINGTNNYIRLVFNVNTSDNKWFYSVDGKLYRFSDDSIVDMFNYN